MSDPARVTRYVVELLYGRADAATEIFPHPETFSTFEQAWEFAQKDAGDYRSSILDLHGCQVTVLYFPEGASAETTGAWSGRFATVGHSYQAWAASLLPTLLRFPPPDAAD